MSNQEIKRDYIKFCETNPHDENYTIPTADLESLLTLIDQQAQEIGYVKRNLEGWTDRALTAESSLELAVKALELELESAKIWGKQGTVVRISATLDQIRRLET